MTKIIDFNKYTETTKVKHLNGNIVTIYSFKDVETRNYCREHHGLVNIDEIVYEWHEDCKHKKNNTEK